MISVRHFFLAILCLVYVPQITSAFLSKTTNYKRFGQIPGSQEKSQLEKNSRLLFTREGFQSEVVGTKYGSVVLECEVTGTSPTIHWLKKGVKISQGSTKKRTFEESLYEDPRDGGNKMLRLSVTHSRLFLDCLNDADEAEYTCVAQNAYLRISRSTDLRVEDPENFMYPKVNKCKGKRSKRGEPARIYMWTVSRLEYENNKVQLFCRASGMPRPTITWYSGDKPIQDDEDYKTAENGDLIIREITWERNMAVYTCVAENIFGTDTAETFLYPTARADGPDFPF